MASSHHNLSSSSSSGSPRPNPRRSSSARQEAQGNREEAGREVRGDRSRTGVFQSPANPNRVDYLVYAQMFEINTSRQPPPQIPHHPYPPPQSGETTHPNVASTASGRGSVGSHTHGHQHQQHQQRSSQHEHQPQPQSHGPTVRRSSSNSTLRPPNFAPEDQMYLQGRLPVRQPITAQTTINHFRRLPFLYQDLAEGCRARAVELPQGGRERDRRLRMAAISQRLADKYQSFHMVLPRSYMDDIIMRWQNEQRTSRFWEKVLDEVENANNAWSIIRLWILLFVIQSSLVAVVYSALPGPGQVILLTANALAYIWSVTVMCEMLQARYVDVKTEEQELHDLMGGLQL